jgi:hypothetical protein
MSAPRRTPARPGTSPAALVPAPAPDPLGPLRGVVRRWPVVVATTVVLVAAALAAGLVQSPTYTATSDINVGRVDVRVQTLPGYVAGAQALAGAYSRVATSDQIVTGLARRLRLPAGEVRSRLAATPIPEATIFRISGSGDSAADAVRFTRAATAEMEAYVASTDDDQSTLTDVLGDYREQSRAAADLRQRIDRLRALQTPTATPTVTATATPSASAKRRARERRADEIARLQVALDTAELKMQSLGSRYAERGNELAATAGIAVLNRPLSATSDRSRTLQRLVAVGLVAGVLLGAALALLYDRRRGRIA